MEMESFYAVLILIIAYAGLKLFSWYESNQQGKSSFWTRNLIETGHTKR